MEEKAILLVEDNPDDELLTIRALKKSKILNRIIVAHDGEEALAMMFKNPADVHSHPNLQPSLILLDIKLPKIDGLQVLEIIRNNPYTSLFPVVLLTSSKEDCDMIKGYKLGCNSYVRKPVNFEEFMEAVQQLGLYWLLLNQELPQV